MPPSSSSWLVTNVVVKEQDLFLAGPKRHKLARNNEYIDLNRLGSEQDTAAKLSDELNIDLNNDQNHIQYSELEGGHQDAEEQPTGGRTRPKPIRARRL
jgi:hypothetical protein